ncbi:MAG: maleylpyruvate isomerase N-terminal domain-containing protein [Acidimicrobiales bacterium]
MTATAQRWIEVLRDTHDRLFTFVASLEPDDLRRQSYCDDWSVAQVLSHIGSAAEIGRATLLSALGGGEPYDQAGREALWARWNAKSPDEQAADAAVADEGLVSEWEQIEPDRLATLRVPFFAGMEFGAAESVGLVLGERALHSWDVFVTFDPEARVHPDAVELLVDQVGRMIPWFGKAANWTGPGSVAVHTTAPERDLTLRIGDTVSLDTGTAGDGGAGASLNLPAEAFLRLVYGRLDAGNAPASVTSEGVDLDQLRQLFPGF